MFECEMTTRIIEDDDRGWQVSDKFGFVEVFACGRSENDYVLITVYEESDCNSQKAYFNISAEEATALKEFLIRKGY